MKLSRPALMASLALLLVLIALLVPLLRVARMQGALDSCAANLHHLHQRMEEHLLQHRRTMKLDEPIGKAFWAQLRQDNPATNLECPARESTGEPRIDYLGPPTTLSRLASSDPLGCDEEGNHGTLAEPTGMVVQKAGDVRQVQGAEWKSLIAGRKCIP